MRVIVTSQEEAIPFSTQIVNALVSILGKICKNPTNPSFNHYLFESISATIMIVRYIFSTMSLTLIQQISRNCSKL